MSVDRLARTSQAAAIRSFLAGDSTSDDLLRRMDEIAVQDDCDEAVRIIRANLILELENPFRWKPIRLDAAASEEDWACLRRWALFLETDLEYSYAPMPTVGQFFWRMIVVFFTFGRVSYDSDSGTDNAYWPFETEEQLEAIASGAQHTNA